jgi:hypothetical protein
MSQIFTAPDTWVGGLYELALELPERSDATIAQALTTIWQIPALTGCYLSRDVEPEAQTEASPFDIPHEGHVYGIAQLPNGKNCACGSYVSDLDADGLWVALYVPLGSLGRAYYVGGYPFGDWSPTIESTFVTVNTWLKEISDAVYEQFHFVFGVIGFESAFEELKKQALVGIPETRSEGLIIPEKNTLRWYPPTYDRHF